MFNKTIAVTGLAALGCIFMAVPAQAAFVQIPLVTPGYISNTTLIPITQPACTNTGNPADPCPAGSIVSSMSATGFTVNFSSPDAGNLLVARAPVPVGFGTWNVPPFVETSTPRVLQDLVNLTCTTCTLNMTFSTPVKTFGFEAEPDPFGRAHTITATFLNGAATVGTIPFTFSTGNSSARLFAASTDQQFTGVNVTIDGTDFALAQFRFGATAVDVAGNPVPEPGTIALMLSGLAILGYRRFRKA